jgi:hypothetical protein
MANALPLTLQNGIYLQTKEFTQQTHLDSAHLMMMDSGRAQDATDLGMITPWITTGYMDRPGMWNLLGNGKNRLLYSEGNIFKFQQPIAEQPTYSVEDITQTDKPGIDGTEFPIKLNKRTFGNSAIITVDKFSGLSLYVTAREIRQDGDGFIYWVKLQAANKKFKWFPKEYLKQGTIFFQTGSVLGEYGSSYNDMGDIKTGYREFYNYVGDGYANAYFTCTRDAALSKVSSASVKSLQEYRKIIEMYQLRPGSAAYDVSRQGQSPVSVYMESGMTEKEAQKAVSRDIVKKAWIPEVEMLGMRMVEKDIENTAMWNPGGTLDVQGKTQVRMPMGVFHQLNLGPTFNYNIPKFTLRKLEAWLISRLKDKIDPYGTNVIKIGTGRAGMKIVRKQMLDVAVSQGMTIDSAKYIIGTDNMKLRYDGPNFMAYRMSFGWVEFEHIPALDPIVANDIENPLVDGERLSSYMFIIDDLSASNDNIYEVVYGPDYDFHHFYINGRMNYMDSGNFGASKSGPYQASNTGPGFEVYLEKRHKCYWIKDITKSLLIKPFNPYTGRPLFEPYF